MTLFVICDSALPGRNDGVARGIVCRLVFIFVTPPSYGHLPYILHSKTPGRREVNTSLVFIFLTKDLYIALRHPVMLWDTAGEEVLKCHSNNEP